MKIFDRFWMWVGLTVLNGLVYYIGPNTISLIFMVFSLINMCICYYFADALEKIDERIKKEKKKGE